MNRDHLYERRESASRMEAVMLVVTGVSILAAIVAFLRYGWLSGLGLLILGALAFGLSRVFDLIGELFALNSRPEGTPPAGASEGSTRA